MPTTDHLRFLFPAKVTAKTDSGGTWLYDWTEQRPASGGGYADADNPRAGSAAGVNAAREVNNAEITVDPDNPVYVWMRLRGGKSDGNLVYEFQAGSGGGPAAPDCEVTFVTGICRIA